MKKITIYTDGACSGNPGPGGWAALLMYQEVQKTISGHNPHTTNNQMELLAVIEALKVLKSKCSVALYTDSEYVRKGITEWIFKWQQNNWKTAGKKEVKNIELWQELLKQTNKHEISWHWVKGHSNDYYNDMVDELAVKASKPGGI